VATALALHEGREPELRARPLPNLVDTPAGTAVMSERAPTSS
jgi:hypothetical protein